MTTTVRADGTLILNGTPFFPFGFFHQSDYGRSPTDLLHDLELIGGAGFNSMHVVIWEGLTVAEWGQFYDVAAQLGVHILAQVSPSAPPSFVTEFKDRPNVLGWYIADDVQASTDFAALAVTNLLYKTFDPGHITNYAALMSRLVGIDPGRLADTFGCESYPVGDSDALAYVGVDVKAAVAAAALHQQSPWAYLQTFSWPGKLPPTFAQYQNMMSQALAAGAKGILNYTFFDGANYLPNYTELWTGLKTLPAALKNKQPTWALRPSASFSGSEISLTALGADDGGEAALIYSWGTVGAIPGPILFSANRSNAAKLTTARVAVPGKYTFRCTIADAMGSRTSADVIVNVVGGVS